MQLLRAILTPLVAAAVLATAAPLVQAQNRGDDTLLEMHQAFRKGDRKKLEQLLPAARGHALEPWAAYWELKLRLGEASPAEIQAFLKRYAGTYQEDRLRNDWLLLLGQRRDWSQFTEQHPSYRMSDDKEVRCYALLIDTLKGTAPATAADEVRRNWYAQRDSDDGCTHGRASCTATSSSRPTMSGARRAWRWKPTACARHALRWKSSRLNLRPR